MLDFNPDDSGEGSFRKNECASYTPGWSVFCQSEAGRAEHAVDLPCGTCVSSDITSPVRLL